MFTWLWWWSMVGLDASLLERLLLAYDTKLDACHLTPRGLPQLPHGGALVHQPALARRAEVDAGLALVAQKQERARAGRTRPASPGGPAGAGDVPRSSFVTRHLIAEKLGCRTAVRDSRARASR